MGLEGGRVKVDGLDAADDHAGALDGRARLEAADVVEVGVEFVGLGVEAEVAQIGRLQRHEEQGHKAHQHKEPHTKFQCSALHSFFTKFRSETPFHQENIKAVMMKSSPRTKSELTTTVRVVACETPSGVGRAM